MTGTGPLDPSCFDKTSLRTTLRARRAALDEEARREAAQTVGRVLLDLPEIRSARRVLVYAAFGDELDLDPFAAALLGRGVEVCLPRVAGEALEIAAVEGLAALAVGWRGVREPPSSAPPVPPTALDAAVVPGLAFDRSGARLGYGGGHFDRLLARLSPTAAVIGACFQIQLVEALPVEPHDQPVHVVVTECEVVRPR
jgi:5-formyltetrahydrofolate cyclo-ligase